MVKPNYLKNSADFSLCKEVFEKFGERRLIGRGEYFAHSCEVMEYASWIVSGGFKYSLTSSDGNNRVIGFSLDDSILIDYESVMHSTKTRTDIIALEDSEVIVIPARIMRERLKIDHELNMNLTTSISLDVSFRESEKSQLWILPKDEIINLSL